MTFPSVGPATQSTGNVAGGPYVAWSGTNTTQVIGPAGSMVPLAATGGLALYDGANSISSGTARFSNANGVSFGIAGQTITASAAGGGVNLNAGANSITSGTAVFSNSNGVSFGIAGQTVTASVAAGGVTGISSIADSARTQTVGMLSFANSNGVTFGLSTGANTATLTASYTVPSTAGLISAVNLSAGTTSSNLSAVTFSNSNGVSFGLNGATVTGSVAAQSNQTMGLYASSQTTGQSSSSTVDARSITLVGIGNVSVGLSAGSQLISVTAPGTGTTFAGTNVSGSLTLNTAGLNVALSAPASVVNATVSYYEQHPWRGALTALAGAGAITNTTVVCLQPFIVDSPISFYRGMLINSASTISTTLNVTLPVSTSLANSTGSARASTTWTMALYSRVSTGTNANSSNITWFASTTVSSSIGISFTNSSSTQASTGTITVSSIAGLGFISQIDSAGGITSTSTTVGSSTSFTATTTASSNFATTVTATLQNNFVTGGRPVDFALASSLSAGEYWFGVQQGSGSASGGTITAGQNLIQNTAVLYGASSNPSSFYRAGFSAATAAATFPDQFYGSVSSAQSTTTIGSNQLTQNAGAQTWFNLMAATL